MRRWALAAAVLAVAAACGKDSTGPVTPPALESLTPEVGTVGTEVAISGSGFDPGTEVYFGPLRSPRVEVTGGVLYALAPVGIEAGHRYDVRVVRPGGAGATLEAAFEAVPPRAARVNGVTRPTGLVGMTVIIEGTAFGDSLALSQARVLFTDANGAPIQAAVGDSVADWTNDFIVTRVPAGIGDVSLIRVETPTGTSDPVEFRLIQSGVFSPSLIHWTATTPLPQPLQGLGAVFVPVRDGAAPENYVYAVGGADSLEIATTAVYRAPVAQTGALGEWSELAPLPAPRVYHASAAATAYTAALDTLNTAAVLYAIGGRDSGGHTVNTVYFAPVGLGGQIQGWSATAPLPEPLHSAGAAVFRGYLYLVGGASSDNTAVSAAYRARVQAGGALGAWEPMVSLPAPVAYHSLVNFGPYLYAVGGDTGATPPGTESRAGTETSAVHFGRIDMRTGDLLQAGWTHLVGMAKERSKHSAIFAGGAVFVTSGVYAGAAGSSENTYAVLESDGTLQPWQGATGSDIIASEIGYSLYNQAAVTFIDGAGNGHVLVLGGARRGSPGVASAAVVYY